MRLFLLALTMAFAGCSSMQSKPVEKLSSEPNERPGLPPSSAQILVDACEITVRFNLDETSVKEDEYLDSMYCLGVMEGVLQMSTLTRGQSELSPLFCPPDDGIKNWIAARTVVEFAKNRTDLAQVNGVEFAVLALATAYPCQ